MSARIPGSSWSNPIEYKGWRIFVNDIWPYGDYVYAYIHNDYDGPEDNRLGYEPTIEACKAAIDEIGD